MPHVKLPFGILNDTLLVFGLLDHLPLAFAL